MQPNRTHIVKGLDSIVTVTNLPTNPRISADTMIDQTLVNDKWNKSYIAMLPFCFKCKEPLTWHNFPSKSGILFNCPICGTTWKKDKNWDADAKAHAIKVGEEKSNE